MFFFLIVDTRLIQRMVWELTHKTC